jgi:carnitine O-acetyltransferase
MNQYRRLFGITRVPKANRDLILGEHPSHSKHIILLIKDQVFVVFVYSEDGKRLRLQDIAKQFQNCVDSVQKLKLLPPICVLGGQDRDAWAADYDYLVRLDKKNLASMNWIQTALFAVSLDHRIVPHDVTSLAKNVFHGFDGHNRWSDKSLNIVVTNDGRLGVHGEHSPCDALIPAQLVDFAVQREPAQDPPNASSNPSIRPSFRLEFVIDSKIQESLVRAQSFVNDLIQDSDVAVMHYSGYGSDFIKTAKVSPDAYIQMCLQLTFFRIHGYTCGVYETASTRKYLHGRTETCRSHTVEQKAFVRVFESQATPSEKYKALQTACKAHIDYIQMASNGFGVDRHLLGLKLCLKEGESHEIFTHPVFAQSQKWQLSTSALFSGDRLIGTGFGTVYPDGYGTCD